MRPRNAVAKAAALLLTFSCCCSISFAQEVKVKYLPGSHISKFQTYKWGKVSQSPPTGAAYQDIDQTIRGAVNVMLQKHFTKVDDSGAADLLVIAQFAVQQKQEWSGLDPHITASSALIENPGEMTIEVGTVILDVYSARLDLLWHGRVRKVFDEHDNTATKQKSIDEALTKLLKDFPPE